MLRQYQHQINQINVREIRREKNKKASELSIENG